MKRPHGADPAWRCLQVGAVSCWTGFDSAQKTPVHRLAGSKAGCAHAPSMGDD
jgi:hypothetical protein